MKHREILDALADSIRKRDGQERLDALNAELKGVTFEAMARELTCQILAREPLWHRVKFLCLYPDS